jgi:hypothetical protein
VHCLHSIQSVRRDTVLLPDGYFEEQISWQEEEAAWGAFVPYAITQAAADRSIQQFHAKGEWPGSEPPIQSTRQGVAPTDVSYDSDDWTDWVFVPDGLLVWEAWLQWLNDRE